MGDVTDLQFKAWGLNGYFSSLVLFCLMLIICPRIFSSTICSVTVSSLGNPNAAAHVAINFQHWVWIIQCI